MSSVIERLGFAPQDRVVIIHADDVGACHAANLGSFATLEAGIVSCGSILVPSPWFPEVAAYARAHPEADLGVHLTLTCEYESYRWGPVSPAGPGSGLRDEQGYLWRTTEAAWDHVTAEEAGRELRAQIERALEFGIDVTHIDTHMGTVFHPKFLELYVQLALEYQVPCFFPRVTEEMAAEAGVAQAFPAIQALMASLESRGYPLLDHMVIDTLIDVEDKLAFYKEQFDGLQPGLTHLLLHPAVPTPELEGLGHMVRSRAQDYQVFTSSELRGYLAEAGVKIIGYRRLRDMVRGA